VSILQFTQIWKKCMLQKEIILKQKKFLVKYIQTCKVKLSFISKFGKGLQYKTRHIGLRKNSLLLTHKFHYKYSLSFWLSINNTNSSDNFLIRFFLMHLSTGQICSSSAHILTFDFPSIEL